MCRFASLAYFMLGSDGYIHVYTGILARGGFARAVA